MRTEDEKAFGVHQWVYCAVHKRPHTTGWCNAPASLKIGLGIYDDLFRPATAKAIEKCKKFGLMREEEVRGPLMGDEDEAQDYYASGMADEDQAEAEANLPLEEVSLRKKQ